LVGVSSPMILLLFIDGYSKLNYIEGDALSIVVVGSGGRAEISFRVHIVHFHE